MDGYPAKHVVIARRKGPTWYIAGINGEPTAKKLFFGLDFIKSSKTSVLITDGADGRSFEISANIIKAKQPMKILLKSNGGFLAKVALQ